MANEVRPESITQEGILTLSTLDGEIEVEPTVERRERSVSYRWPLGERTDERGSYTVNAVLTIHHHKPGPNYMAGTVVPIGYFGGTLLQEIERDGTRSFQLFSGTGVLKNECGRFSQKRLSESEHYALGNLTVALRKQDPRIVEHFTLS